MRRGSPVITPLTSVKISTAPTERVAERDRGEVAAAAAERRHGAGLGHALKAGDDRDDAALERGEHVAGSTRRSRASPKRRR
jgi:hypothetical protein